MICIRVLGSCAAERGGEAVPLGGRRQRAVLARLVAARGQVVSVDRLVDDLWQEAAPAQAVTSLQAYVSNLRRLLEPGRAPRTPAKLLVSSPPGYALQLPDGAVDAWRFERLLDEARAAHETDPHAAQRQLTEALELWQGPAYAEFADDPWAAAEVLRLAELRVVARELRVAAQLRGGNAALSVADAEILTRDEPLREEGWRLHALALWAAGRQADSLATLRRARAVLADEVGLDPGPALAALEEAVLTQDAGVLRSATSAGSAAGPEHSRPPRNITPRSDSPGPAAGPALPDPVRTSTEPQAAPPDRTPQASPPAVFLGRDTELRNFAAAADRALAAGPGFALLTGEAGLGKSAVLRRLGAHLAADEANPDWLVAVGRTTDAEGAPPAWPWVEALRTIAAVSPPPAQLAPILAPLLGEAAADAPAEAPAEVNTAAHPAPSAGIPHGDAPAGRFHLHRAVLAWLTAAADRHPVALFLDDLHWADAETLALLTTLTELPSGTRIFVVAAYRPDEADARLADALAALARTSPVRVALPGLPAEAVAGTVAEIARAAGAPPVDAATVAALAERTGGNPFYVRESAQLLVGEGALVALSDVPDGVRDVLRRRLARLPDQAVAVLRLAAAVGRESDVDVVAHAADVDEDAVFAALEAGIIAGLLTEPTSGRVRFVHALVRDTLLADVSRLRATRMHARIAASLEALGSSDVTALAHHFARSVAPATAARALDYCLRAAALAESRYAYDVAASQLAHALAAFDRQPGTGGTPDERSDLLGRLLQAQLRAGAIMDARATRHAAIDHALTAGRDDLLIAAFTAWSEPTPWQTRPYGMVDTPVLTQLRRLLDDSAAAPGPEVRCRLLLAYAAELSDLRDPTVRAAAREALALAADLADASLHAQALAAILREHDVDREADEQLRLSADLVTLATDHDLPVHLWYGLFEQASAVAVLGDVPEARRLVDACADLARAHRMPGPTAVADCAQATLAHIAGRLDEAEALYREASAGMARQGSPHAEGFLDLALAAIAAGQGRLAEVLPRARELHSQYGPFVNDLLTACLAAAGHTDEARALLRTAGPIQTDFLFRMFATYRATAMSAIGHTDGAAELYDILLPYRDAPPPSSGFTLAMRPVAATLADLADLLGRTDTAAEHRANAAEIAARWETSLGSAPVV
ncbi:BTAD domain-containing putative transcriptional regulator [Uniformispora flossi]|uniref:BTAD domain-containing putative transcriptional regulator n=1 Tax=Uniformispora flossi TaxID=3390723 RepID=UPI003C2C40DD